MINSPSTTRRRRSRTRASRGGFTLIEIIVVIGIIALLAAMTVGIVSRARKSAGRTKTALDLQAIGVGLEEYRKDHGGQYPPVVAPNTGFAVLARDLIGTYGDGVNIVNGNPIPDPLDPPPHDGAKEYAPGECVNSGNYYVCLEADGNPQPAPPNPRYWAVFDPRDGRDGPGTAAGGRKFPAYLQPEKFRVRGNAILDSNDKPILYFPARGNPNVTVASGGGTPSYCELPIAGNPKYHVNDNWQFFTRVDDTLNTNAEKRVQIMMGDTDFNGTIGPGETAVATMPYVLWSAGPDGFFGPTKTAPANLTASDASRCDDVISFQR